MEKANKAFQSFINLFLYNRNKDRKEFCQKEAIRLLKTHRENTDAIISNPSEWDIYENLRDNFLDEYNNPKRVYWPWIFFFISIVSFFGLMFYIRFYC